MRISALVIVIPLLGLFVLIASTLHFMMFGMAEWQFCLCAWDCGIVMTGQGASLVVWGMNTREYELAFPLVLAGHSRTGDVLSRLKTLESTSTRITVIALVLTVAVLAALNFAFPIKGHAYETNQPYVACRGDGVWTVEECATPPLSQIDAWKAQPVALDVPGGELVLGSRMGITGPVDANYRVCSIDRGRTTWISGNDNLCRTETSYERT